MSKRKFLLKRSVALFMVFFTLITSWSVDWNALSVQAATYTGKLTDSGHQVYSGGAIAQIFTGTSDYTQVTGTEFRIGVDANETVKYKVTIYQNLTSQANPETGVNSYTGSYITVSRGDTSVDSVEDINVDLLSAKVYLATGETCAVVITLTSSNADNIVDYYASPAASAGYEKTSSSASWAGPQFDSQVVTTALGVASTTVPAVTSLAVSDANVILANGQSQSETVTLSPAYARNVTYSGYDASLISVENGVITANNSGNAGQTTITVTAAGGATPKTTTIAVTVVKATLAYSSVAYDGTVKTPVVTVTDGTNTYTSDSFSAYFSITYTNNTNVGTAGVSVVGLSGKTYEGFTWSSQYAITAKSLTDTTLSANIASGTYTINPNTNAVTSATVTGLTFGTDYTVTATRANPNTYGTTLEYNLVITGKGNYKDSVTKKSYMVYTASSGTLIDISDIASASPSTTTFVYDGTAKEPTISYLDITDGETSVNLSGCVNVVYSNNTNAGTATATITGDESVGYTGTLTCEYTIAQASISSVATAALSSSTVVYTGTAITPTPTVTLNSGGATLVKTKDYTVTYSNNTNIGTATVTIKGSSNYKGSMTKNFEIIGNLATQAVIDVGGYTANHSNNFVSGYSVVYSGTAKQPTTSVAVDTVSLVEGTDYSLTFSNNTGAGKASIIITGIGNYAGQSVTAYFTIAQKNLTGSIKLSTTSLTYTGSPITQSGYTVICAGTTLAENTDYTVEYSNNKNAGTATITAKGMGNYSGSLSNTYTIAPLNLSACTLSVNNQTYTGGSLTPAVTLMYQSNILDASTGYTLAYSNNVNIGTATVTATGNTNLIGTASANFTISARDISSLNFTIGGVTTSAASGNTISSDYSTEYTGTYQKPAIIVKNGTTTLVSGTDYSLTYGNNKSVADVSSTSAPYVTVTGLNSYYGSAVTIKFSIKTRDISTSAITIAENGPVSETNQAPDLVLSDSGITSGSKILTKGTDYTVSYSETSKAGNGYTATITGVGNYTGSRTYGYDIGANFTNEASAYIINPLTNTETKYTGSSIGIPFVGPIHPSLNLYVAASKLVAGTDYTVSYASSASDGNQYNAGNTITVTFTAKSTSTKYYGTKTLVYNIEGVSMTTYPDFFTVTSSNASLVGGVLNYNYTAKSIATSLIVTYNPKTTAGDTLLPTPVTLAMGTDYTYNPLSIGPNITAENGTITIMGRGNYTATTTAKYAIAQADISSSSFSTSTASFAAGSYTAEYTGAEIKPMDSISFRQTVGDSYVILTQGTDYTVTYTNNVNKGTATCVIDGIGNYTGKRTITFSITARKMSSSKVEVSPLSDAVYSGSAIAPVAGTSLTGADFMVSYDGKVLRPGASASDPLADYYVTYSNNTNPGQATVTITGINNYSDTKAVNFNIVGNLEGKNGSDAYLFTETGIVDGGAYVLDGDGSLYYEGDTGKKLNLSSLGFTYNNGSNTLKNTVATTYFTTETTGLNAPGTGAVTMTGTGSYCKGKRVFTIHITADIADITAPVLDDSYAYTGAAVTPTPEIVYAGKILTTGVDYTLSYTNNTAVGTATLKVTGAPGSLYTGTSSYTFNIRYDLNKATISDISAQKYTGSQITPTFTVTIPDKSAAGGRKQLSSNKDIASGYDYTISYGANVNAGTATVTIVSVTGKSVGTQTKDFVIATNALTADMVSDVANSTYDGTAQQPAVTVTFPSVGLLNVGKDYTLTYSNNVNTGTATITVTGTGNYVGTVTKNFTIAAKSIGETGSTAITATISPMTYAGGLAVKPAIVLYDVALSKYLVEGTDYSVSVSDNTSVTNNAKVTLTGLNNYTGTRYETFAIVETNLSSSVISVADNTTEYTGKPVTVDFTVQCSTGIKDANGKVIYYSLVKDQDYTVSYNGSTELPSMIDAGAYYITITAKDGSSFTGSNKIAFNITSKELVDHWVEENDKDDTDGTDSYTVTYNQNVPYTGASVKPNIQVVDNSFNDYVLKEGTDYSVAYSNNIDSASASDPTKAPTITITGKGNYSGTLLRTFNIGTDLSTATIELTPTVYEYNGASQIPTESISATVNASTVTLVRGTDYTLSAPTDTINAGTKTVAFTGKGAFYGTKSANYVIQAKAASADTIFVGLNLSKDGNGNYYTTYAAAPITPTVTVYDTSVSKTTPVAKADYTVSYTNNQNAGNASNMAAVSVQLTNNYKSGSKTIQFIIRQADISGYSLTFDSGSNSYDYTGSPIEPVYTVSGVTSTGTTVNLSKGTDFTETFANNTNAGKAGLTITGKGNYIGTLHTDFGIYASLNNASVTIADQFYTGEAMSPLPTVVCAGNTLTAGTDYTVTYYSTDQWNTIGYATITPKNPYYGGDVVTASFHILSDISLLSIKGVANQYIYTGDPIKPSFTVESKAKQKIDYKLSDVTYQSTTDGTACTSIGTVTLTVPITLAGKTENLKVVYTIVPRNINICTLSRLSSDTYTGKSLTPPTSVRYDNEELVRNSDYQVSYTNNVNPGTAAVTLVGSGNYTGAAVLYFNIQPAAMKNLKASTQSSSQIKLSWSKVAHISGYQIIYQNNGKQYKKTTTKTSYTVSGLKACTTDTFAVRTYVRYKNGTSYTYKYGEMAYVTGLTKLSTPKLSVKATSSRKAYLTWKKVSSADGYDIYRATSKKGSYKKQASIPQGTYKYTNSKLINGKRYYYKIQAYRVTSAGKKYCQSSYSNIASVTAKN